MKCINKYIRNIVLGVLLIGCGIAENAVAQTTSLDQITQRAQNAGIEQSVLDELKSRKEKRGLSNQQLINIIEPAVQLAEENMPANHILQKGLEGLSKGVPDSRIVPYINRMADDTRQAAKIVDPWLQKDKVQQKMGPPSDASATNIRNRMVESSSRAITQNITSNAINDLLTAIENDDVMGRTSADNIVSAMDVLPDLPMTDQPELTKSFVIKALKGGFEAGEFQKLPTALSMAQKRSQIPAASIIQGISNQLQNGVPANDILKNLFDGNIGGGPPGDIPKGMENNPGRGNQGGNGNAGNG